MRKTFVVNKKQLIVFVVLIPINAVMANILAANGVNGHGIFYQLICLNLSVFLIFKGLGEKTLLNPYYAFAICPLSLAIYMPSVSSFYLEQLDDDTYKLLIYNFLMFMFGITIFRRRNKRNYHKKKKRWPVVLNSLENVRWANFFIWVSMIPVLISIALGSPGGWNSIKTVYAGIPLSGITNMFVLIGLVFAFKSKRRRTILFAIIATMTSAIALLTKTSMMFAIVLIVGSFDKYYNNRRYKTWQYILFFIGLVLFAWADGMYTTIRGAELITQVTISRFNTNIIPANYVNTYLYLVGAWSNTQYIMRHAPESTHGLWTLKTFIGYLGLDSNFSYLYIMPHPTSFNVFGYVSYFFKDFGIVGSGIASLILGIIMKRLYSAYKTSDSPFLVAVYLFNFRAIMMMFFNNHWCTGAYPITVFILMWLFTFVYKYLKKQKQDLCITTVAIDKTGIKKVYF